MKLDAKGNILSTNRLSNKDKSLWCFYGDYGPNSIYSDNYCYFIMATSLLNPFFDPDFDHNVLLKTDTNLNPIWAKRYSHPSDTRTKLYSIKVINNDIYLCGKGVTSGEGFLSKTDTSGSLLWTKSIPKGDYVSLAPRNKSTFIPIIDFTFLSNGNILLFSGVENNNDNIFPILLKSDTSSNLKGCETFISPLNVSPISLTTGSFNHPPKNNKFITWSKNITSRDITQNFRDTSICPWEQRDTTICNGDSLKISGQFYKVAGVYPDSFLNIHGCDSITLRNLMISNDQSPQVDLGNDTTLCDRDQITIQNRISSTLDKQWHDGSSNASYVASSPGEYWLMEQNGCGETRDTIIIGLEPNPSISLGNDTSICEGEQLRLIAQTDGVRVIWNDLSIGTTMDIDQGGTYWAISESSKGCKNSDTIDVELIDCEDFELRMPNVFTPNGDDLNETFKPVLNKGLDYLIMSIYNRWGEKIYETSDAQKGWDGIYRGKDVPDGTYFWLLEYENPKNNQMKYLNGTVTLIR
jgi:gliding motility-associated-like protein